MRSQEINCIRVFLSFLIVFISFSTNASQLSTGTLICTPNDTICPGDSITITVQNPTLPIQWSDGSSLSSIKVAPSVTTTYYLIENYGSSFEDTLFLTITVINVLTFIDIHSTPICLGDTSFINLIHPNGLHYWSTGDTMISYIHVSPPVTTDYYVINTAGTNCADTINFTITVIPRSTSDIFFKDTVCRGESVTLTLTNPKGNILWTDSVFGNDLNFIPEHDTSLTVINDYLGACPDTLKVKIVVKPPNLPLVKPNIFTPNGDRVNDVFSFDESNFNKHFYSIRIFSRWGILLYESKDPVIWWNGIYNGSAANEGTYFWLVEYFNQCTQSTAIAKGFVTLLR